MSEIIRRIEPEIKDFLAVFLLGASPMPKSISEAKIARFCQKCDNLKSDGVCRLDSNNQAGYVARNWCGWASKNGVRGTMTNSGFES